MMLFKRVSDSFRHIEGREWALLCLETLGVLIGILVAFELQEWAGQRADAAKHRQLMERLFDESETDVAVLRSMRGVYQEASATERNFAVAVSAGKCPDEAAWSAVATVNMYPPLTAPSGVYDELMGAGGLSSIEVIGSRRDRTVPREPRLRGATKRAISRRSICARQRSRDRRSARARSLRSIGRRARDHRL